MDQHCLGTQADGFTLITMELVDSLFAVLGAIVGAMLVWSAVIVGGRWLIHALKLPTDLPDECKFEPKPPPVSAAPGAAERAAFWKQRAEICAIAREAVLFEWKACECIEDPSDPLRQQLQATTQRAQQHMHLEDLARARSETVAARDAAGDIWRQIETSHPAPPQNKKILIMLLIALIVCLLWSVIGMPMLSNALVSPP